MSKLKTLTLEQLYNQPRITPATKKYIMLQEDFSKISPNWCTKVCTVKNKQPPSDIVFKRQVHVDILIISDFVPPPDTRYNKSQDAQKRKEETLISNLITPVLRAGSYSVITLLKCQTPTVEAQKDMLCCTPYLLSQINTINPKVIVSLSTTVTKALGLKNSNTTDCGRIFMHDGRIPVVLTLHPRLFTMVRQNMTGALWGSDYSIIFRKDLEKAKQLLDGELKYVPLEEAIEAIKPKIRICRTINEVKQSCEMLNAQTSICAFDIETTGLDPYAPDARVLCVQFGYKTGPNEYSAVVIPLFHKKDPNLTYDPAEAWHYVAAVLLNPKVQKVGHNIKFDVKYVAVTLGVRTQGIVFDTMLIEHSIYSGIQGLYSLKTLIGYRIPEMGLSGYEDLIHSEPESEPEPEQ